MKKTIIQNDESLELTRTTTVERSFTSNRMDEVVEERKNLPPYNKTSILNQKTFITPHLKKPLLSLLPLFLIGYYIHYSNTKLLHSVNKLIDQRDVASSKKNCPDSDLSEVKIFIKKAD